MTLQVSRGKERIYMRVQDRKTAWFVAKRLFPTDIRMSDAYSQETGFPVFVSATPVKKYDGCTISDMGDRLVVDRKDVRTVIHIRDNKQPKPKEEERIISIIRDAWDKARAEYALAKEMLPGSDMSRDAESRLAALDELVGLIQKEAGNIADKQPLCGV